MEKKIIHIIPSTHWDREWYLPFRRYQVRLIRLIEKVIKLLRDDEYPNYLLDGQCIMLEDYLEIKPQDEGILKELIRKGRLVPGPWYTVPDMMIPSGESLIRNLLIGYKICNEFGGCLNVGYSPDTFGLVSQMPQIYRLFGYKYAMFSRGLRLQTRNQDIAEFIWESPDKSFVHTLNEAYSTGVGITIPSVWKSYDRAIMSKEHLINSFKATMDYQDNRYLGLNRLLIVGIDHLEPNDNLTETISILKEEFKELEIKFSTLEQFFESMEDEFSEFSGNLQKAVGEQRGEYKNHFALGNTMSTRIDIKMLNRKVENKLQYLCEPLHAINPHLDSFNYLDTKPLYENAWKLLVASHAHDSICSCNVDETNQDVKMRILHSYQMAREVEKLELTQLGSSIKAGASNAAIVVYNPLPFSRSERVCGKMNIPCEAPGEVLVDANNNVVENAIIQRTYLKRRDIETMKRDEYQEVFDDTTRVAVEPMTSYDYYTGIEYEFYARDIPACGYKTYYLSEGSGNNNTYINKPENTIENKYLYITANENGSLNITMKSTGRTLSNVHLFEDESDEGDSYTTNPLGDKFITDSLNAKIDTIVSKHDSSMTISLNYIKNNENVEIKTIVSIDKYSDYIYFKTSINNESVNHRIRAIFDIDEIYSSSYSDTAYDLTERPIYQKNDLKAENIMTMPMRNLLYLKGNLNVAIFSKSTQEYEAIADTNKTRIYLTLLRSVDKIYKTYNPTRDETGCGKGVRWFTEDSKLRGEYTFEYSLKFYAKDVCNNDLINDSLSYQIPLNPFGSYTIGTSDSEGSFYNITGAVLSAIYVLDQDKKQQLMRVYNADPSNSVCRIKLNRCPVSVAKVDLIGNIIGSVNLVENNISFDIESGEIANIMIRYN